MAWLKMSATATVSSVKGARRMGLRKRASEPTPSWKPSVPFPATMRVGSGTGAASVVVGASEGPQAVRRRARAKERCLMERHLIEPGAH